MDDKELLTQCYHTMYRGMIEKDMELLEETLDESFVLVHMTGMRQTKRQYMDYIANGMLNYYSEKTEHMEIAVDGEQAKLVGQSRVNAAVFGGGKHVWNLQLSMKAIKRNGKWYITEAKASTYQSEDLK
ncbi:MAG: nuclear transport factor 2 family protein [Lachnospiraceae bacterium]|nr:nuclear transport factor 2 family protein [Lachnospiraceae bacterium]